MFRRNRKPITPPAGDFEAQVNALATRPGVTSQYVRDLEALIRVIARQEATNILLEAFTSLGEDDGGETQE